MGVAAPVCVCRCECACVRACTTGPRITPARADALEGPVPVCVCVCVCARASVCVHARVSPLCVRPAPPAARAAGVMREEIATRV